MFFQFLFCFACLIFRFLFCFVVLSQKLLEKKMNWRKRTTWCVSLAITPGSQFFLLSLLPVCYEENFQTFACDSTMVNFQ